jgi:23S rRNA (uracil1939-C5)-methyltransferase
VVFVPRTAPGDRARIEIVREHARFCRGRMAHLVEPGPHRVEPRCAHYLGDQCGGCQLQHLDPMEQRRARAAIVGDALRRIGRIEVDDPELEADGPEWKYRSRITLSRGDAGFGFHRWDRADRIFALRRCEVAADPLNGLWARLRRVTDRLPPGADRVTLRVDREGGTHVVVETDDATAWTGGPELHAALGGSSSGPTIWWHPSGGAPRAVAGAGEPYPATTFEQINSDMGRRIREFALACLGPVADQRVWDLYAGVGETTERLAAAGAHVQSVEADRRATARAEALTRRFSRVQVRTGRAEDLVSRLAAPRAVITNPPRSGMDARVVDALRGAGASRIAYVSCDPATLARDLRPLVTDGPYRVGQLRAFDLFPQTAHVETVVALEIR